MMRNMLVVLVLTLGLVACAKNTSGYMAEALPPPNLLSDPPPASPAYVRVIVRFKEPKGPLAYGDDAFVKTLQAQTQVPVHYISAVSFDTHVYGLQLPAGQDPAAAVQRLGALPSVARVDMDPAVKAH